MRLIAGVLAEILRTRCASLLAHVVFPIKTHRPALGHAGVRCCGSNGSLQDPPAVGFLMCR